MVQAAPCQVERLDWTGRKAFVRQTKADYYTDAIDYTRLKILERFEQADSGDARAAHGEVHLVRRIPGYKKIRYYTHENVGYGNINLPDQEMHTTAAWWQVEPGVLRGRLPRPAGGPRRLPRRRVCDAPRRGAAHHGRAARPRSRGRRRRREVARHGGRERARPAALGRARWMLAPDAVGRFPAGRVPLRQLPGRRRSVRAAVRPGAEVVAAAHALVAACDCRYGCPRAWGPSSPPTRRAATRPSRPRCGC